MQFTLARAVEGDFSTEEQVELTGEGAFRPASSFCHGFDQTMTFSEPVDDQAGFSEASQSDDNSFRGMHRAKFDGFFTDGDVYPSGVAGKMKAKWPCFAKCAYPKCCGKLVFFGKTWEVCVILT